MEKLRQYISKKTEEIVYTWKNLNKILDQNKLLQVNCVGGITNYSYHIGWDGTFDNIISQLHIYQN